LASAYILCLYSFHWFDILEFTLREVEKIILLKKVERYARYVIYILSTLSKIVSKKWKL